LLPAGGEFHQGDARVFSFGGKSHGASFPE